MSKHAYDIAIIGGGIVGLATALQLSRSHPSQKAVVLEKETAIATHQTGHNSGVIHSGIYYRPGSLKARNCVEGGRALMAFCDENGIDYQLCGKVIVATEIEPYANGLRALHSPNTGIIDFAQVAAAYANRFRDNGGEVLTGARVTSIRRADGIVYLETPRGEIATRNVINCAGLYSDAVARMMGVQQDVRIVPFRGEYYMLAKEAERMVQGLIYPVPNPEFPFLGVHFTRTVHGEVEAGPNAVLAFAREGYRMGRVSPREMMGTLGYRGFWSMSARYWRMGMLEMYRSFSKGAFVRSLQKLVPEIKGEDLVRGNAGVRAQEVERNGMLTDDFHVTETPNAVHVRNAPSPGATASLAIGRDVAAAAAKAFGLG